MAQTTKLSIKRYFTQPTKPAFEMLDWLKVDAKITNPATNEAVFEQKQVEFPDTWSQNAINIVSQKYFYGTPGSKNRENSLKQLINRVVDTITRHGQDEGYFLNKDEATTFSEELKYILASQRASFNSPVWFNIGTVDRSQQASACFILAVEDDMRSILNWYKEEGMIFKGGSGAGINVSPIRSSFERLSKSGGYASGPLSFMRGADSSAGAIKSGGKTRRAAKMVILNADHPDVEEFIWSKAIEERKARVLEANGFDMGLNGRDSISIQYQNANNSVRATDDFMEAVEDDKDWDLRAITNGEVVKTVKAKDLMHQIAEAAWECADPGMQFDTTINKWHTTPNEGRINGSNPCSEYMHVDNSACNLASLNLLKFLNEDGSFDTEAFKQTVELIFTAQEILVGYSDYPTKKIGRNSRRYRQLGIGYANLGALLMSKGLPYDSDEGRAIAAAITALLTGHSYATSAKIARRVGPFAGFNKNRDDMLRVLKMHADAVRKIDTTQVPEDLLNAAVAAWDETLELAELHGVRNAQASVLAPTGTIGLMMDCDTTGIEPDFSLIKMKNLVGGGNMKIVNQSIGRALKFLGYSKAQTEEIVDYISKNMTVVGAPHLKKSHYEVFACSVGDNAIHYNGHIKMMSAVQPFLSGAISKTVNMPEDVTVEDVEQLYIDSWKLGLKAVAIYRDNCKVGQPLGSATKDEDVAETDSKTSERLPDQLAASSNADGFIVKGAVRRRLPNKRKSVTYRFQVADLKGYFTVGEYDDGTPGELFIRAVKHGSTLSGVLDAFAIAVSHGLQHGVPLKAYSKVFMNMTFAPSGITDDEEIKTATSIIDYIFKRLATDYLSFDDKLELGLVSIDDMDVGQDQASLLDQSVEDLPADVIEKPAATTTNSDSTASAATADGDTQDLHQSSKADEVQKRPTYTDSAPLCSTCGNRTQRSGSCYVCPACGTTTGCS